MGANVMYKVQIMVEDFVAFTVWMDNKTDADSLALDYQAKGYTVNVVKGK